MSDIESQRRSSSHNRVHPNDSKPDELVKNHELISMENLKSPPPYITDQEQEKNDRKLEEFNDDDDDSDDETEDPNSGYSKFKNSVVGFLKDLWNRKIFRISLAVFFIALYFAYFGVSMALNNPFGFLSEDLDALNETINVLDDRVFSNNQSLALLVLTIIVVLVALWDTVIFKLASKHLHFKIREDSFFGKFGSWIIAGLVFIGCAIYFFLTLTDPYNMVSLGGIVALILVAVLLSNKRSKINWYILLVGIEIQFIFGVFLLRTEFGYKLFKFLSDQVIKFLEYTDQGSELVFGEKYTDHIFAFKSIPVMIFFSAIINTLYYLGVVQYIILKASWILNFLMGTSPCESMNSTANIFIGITEAPLLIKPFLPSMSRSELFSLMTSGFATVAGTVFAAYVNFKVPANHLIIASIMAAPGALAVSKTIYPATKKSKVDWDTIRSLPRGDAKNIFEAISLGASNMVGPIAGILSNLIAFVAIFAFLDSTVQWAFSLIDVNNFGITDIMQYLFYPFAFLMGIIPEDCKSVSKLIGMKVFVNEFVAYAELGKTIQFRDDIIRTGLFDAYKNGSIALPNDVYMIWNDRSIVISTYALCGFANFGAIGIAIGGLSALAPTRFNVFSGLAFKAMIAGNITNFISASIAGLLYNGV